MTQPIPKEQASADIKLFENYIPSLNADPRCTRCFGKGYSAFGLFPHDDKLVVKLITCRCVTVGKTPYTLLKEQLDRGLGFLHSVQAAQFEALKRRTFFGGFEYLWGRIWRKKK